MTIHELRQRDSDNSLGTIFGLFLLACMFCPVLLLFLIPFFGKSKAPSRPPSRWAAALRDAIVWCMIGAIVCFLAAIGFVMITG